MRYEKDTIGIQKWTRKGHEMGTIWDRFGTGKGPERTRKGRGKDVVFTHFSH